MANARNVLGEPLTPCCHDPKTGFFRTGYCETGPDDHGRHVVCAVMTPEFLRFTVSVGNDLVTPHPEFGFPGLSVGDRWCLCAERWREAYEAGEAPPVVLSACHETALDIVPLELLREYAIDESGEGSDIEQ